MRHIEVDHLWIQEQEAQRTLPIGKVDGGEHPADLMTKNVGIELAKKHMKAMGIRFAEGRSGAPAKLHSIAEKDGWKSRAERHILKHPEDPQCAKNGTANSRRRRRVSGS